jgi:hypothetical protein
MLLPEFKSSKWKCVGACGVFEGNPGDDIEKRIAEFKNEAKDLKDQTYVAEYGADKTSRSFLLAYFGGKYPRHLHVDVIACDCFSSRPEPNRSLDQFRDLLKPFFGKMIKADFSAGFWVRANELPPCGIILGCKVESTMGVMKIKQSSANFTVDRGPIDRISWSTVEDNPDIISIGLYLKKVTTFDRDYLMSFYGTANSIFDYLVLGKEISAERR